jgi:streptogramin lyase
MIRRAVLLVLTLLLTGAAPQLAAVPHRVIVKIIGCADCLVHAPGVVVLNESLNAPIASTVSQRTTNGFVLSLPAGYYDVSVRSKSCNGDRYFGTLPARDRALAMRVRCVAKDKSKRTMIGFVRVVDEMRGLAGTLPDSIRSLSMWPAEGGTRPIKAVISEGAYYFDEANCGYCVVQLNLTGGRVSRVGVSLRSAGNFTLSRRDLSSEEIRSGLSVRGSPFNAPETLVEGPEQSIWILDRIGNRVAVVAPGRRPREFDLPTPFSNPCDIVATDHFVWINELNAGKIVRFGLDGAHTEYAVRDGYNGPLRMTRGADGRLWFIGNNRLGALDENGTLAEYHVPGPVAGLNDLALGADGRLWISGGASTYGLGKPFIAARAASGAWQRFSLSDVAAIVRPGIKGLWVTNGLSYDNYLAYVDLHGHESIAKLPLGSMGPKMYAVDAADNLWFSDRYGNVVGQAAPDGSVVAGYTDFGPPGISDMRIDRNGHLWIAEPQARIVDEYNKGITFPPRGVSPRNLLFDSNGTLWYSDPVADVVGTIAANGTGRCYAFRLSHVKHCTFGRADIVARRRSV